MAGQSLKVAVLAAASFLCAVLGTAPALAAVPIITGYQTTSGKPISSAPPGTQLVVVGSNLGPSGAGVLKFNGSPLSTNAWASTYIRAVVPQVASYPTTAPFTVTTGGQTATGPPFTVTGSSPPPPPPAPTISGYQTTGGSAISSATPGTTIVIVGANLGSSGTVQFNGISAAMTSWTSTAVTASVPTAGSYPNSGPVTVTTGGQTATGPTFTITAPSPPPPLPPPPPPTISGYQNSSGTAISSAMPGTTVVIVGTNLGSSGSVAFNGLTAAATAWSATMVTATVPTAPSYPNTGPVTISTGGQTATGPSFTITAPPPPAPTISGYQTTGGSAISSATPGTTIVIVGANLGSSGTVQFNGISATTSAWSSSAITVTVPSAASYPNTGPVTVKIGGQTATGPNFTITAPPPPAPPAPTISGYQDTSGNPVSSAAPGTAVVIVGANLGTSGTVQFNGISAATTSWTATAVTVTVPTASSYPVTGPVSIITGGQTAVGPSFTIVAPPSGPGPTITGYQTTSGKPISSAPPGTQLVVVGSNLGPSGAGVLKFNGSPLSTNAWASTYIRAVVPQVASYPTTAPFTVTTGGQTATGPPFTVTGSGSPSPPPAPTISGYQTTGGSAIGSAQPGTAVVIVGANLGSSGTVQFNGISAATTSWSSTAITAIVPTASSYPNTGPVTVTTGGQTATGPNFTISAPPPPPPTITGYQDATGNAISSAAPGTQIVVKGNNLGSSGTVQLNGIPASTSTWSSSAITATVPTASSYPNTGPVTVMTGGQTATGPGFTITAPPPPPPPPPTISGYQNSSGTAISSAMPGATVVIVGTNLGSSGSVAFDGLTAAATAWSATMVTATVPTAPSYPNTGPVTISTGGQTATGPSFTITAPPPPAPTISGYQTTGGSAISSATPGTTIVIVGANLGSSGTVQFNGISAATSNWTTAAITATVPSAPAYPNSGPVTVTTGGQTATGASFTITAPPPPPPPAPTISGYQDTSGNPVSSAAPGTAVVIAGANFGASGTVQFNGISAATTSWSSTAITAIVPTASSYPNTGPVTVTTGGQTATGPNFTISAPPPPPPTITGYQDATGNAISSAIPGTTVVIVGTNLGNTGSVAFNGTTAATTAWSATMVTATVPTATSYPSAGPVSVTTGGQTAAGPSFTITAPPPPAPTISGYQDSHSNAISSAAPGSQVVIVGTNLGSSGTVQFNGISTATTNWTASAVTAAVPSGPSYPNTGPVTLTIGGQTATGPNFTIAAPPPPAPTITGYQDTGGAGIISAIPGSVIVITGANFGSSGSVQFNGDASTTSAWSDTSITATVPVPSGSYPSAGPISVTTGGQTATGPNFTIAAPPQPVITGYQDSSGSAIVSALPGTQVVIIGTNFGSSGFTSIGGLAAQTISWTPTAVTVTVPAQSSYPVVGPVLLTVMKQTATGPTFTVLTPPGQIRSVRSYGATGDGHTDDSAAIQSALDAAQPSDSIYFPAGTYHLGSALQVRTANLRLYGDGDLSMITADTTQTTIFNTYNSNGLTGLRFDHLHLVGAGVFDKVQNQGAGISLGLSTGTQISYCTIDGCGNPVIEGAGSGSTAVNNCLIENWGRTGMFMNGGDSVINTTFAQHDPNAADQVTSHAIYIHSGAANCRISNCSFSGVRYYAIQVYGHDTGTTISGIEILGNQFSDNSQDIEVESGGPDISGITIAGNSFWRTKGPSVQLKEGFSMQVENNQFHDLNSTAVVLGNWAPFDVGASLSNITVANNVQTQGGGPAIQYAYLASGTNGSLTNVTFRNNSAEGFQEPGTYQAAGIYLLLVVGATVADNKLTMGSGGGAVNTCAGVNVAGGCVGVQITGNTVNGSGNQYAYGVFAVGLTDGGSAVTNNILNHCLLDAGGATASGNSVTP